MNRHPLFKFPLRSRHRPFTVRELARQLGLRPSAVRYYERCRIIPPAQRLPNDYRVYDAKTLRTLSFVRRAQIFGMSLDNVSELMRLAEDGRTPCERVRQLARQHLKEIDQTVRDLEALKGQLELLLRRKAASKRTRHICPLIES